MEWSAPDLMCNSKDLGKWQNNLLPSHQIGFIVLTTSPGIMEHEKVRRKHTGGEILFFFAWGCHIYVQIKCLNGKKSGQCQMLKKPRKGLERICEIRASCGPSKITFRDAIKVLGT